MDTGDAEEKQTGSVEGGVCRTRKELSGFGSRRRTTPTTRSSDWTTRSTPGAYASGRRSSRAPANHATDRSDDGSNEGRPLRTTADSGVGRYTRICIALIERDGDYRSQQGVPVVVKRTGSQPGDHAWQRRGTPEPRPGRFEHLFRAQRAILPRRSAHPVAATGRPSRPHSPRR